MTKAQQDKRARRKRRSKQRGTCTPWQVEVARLTRPQPPVIYLTENPGVGGGTPCPLGGMG